MNIFIKNVSAALPGHVKTCDIYISGGKIASIGTAPEGFIPEKTIDGAGKLLIPGLINAHTHSYMTVLRNSADDLTFSDWLFGRVMPMEDMLSGDDFYWGSMLACMEMMASGTTAFLDMHMAPHMTARAVCDCGMRAVLSRGLSGGTDDIAGGERRLREALEEFDQWKDRGNLGFMLAPHAPYSCDEGYLREIAAAGKETGLGIHTHLCESVSEVENVKNQYGCTPIELFDRVGLLNNRTVAAHCVHLTDGDIAILADRGVTVATNPVSNLKLANGVAPIPRLMAAGVNIALGTDGSASNNALNMFRDLSFVTLLHKGISGDPRAVTAEEGFLMATANSAAALGLTHISGEIREGYSADFALLDLNRPNMQPLGDPIAAIAYSATGAEVETVIIRGEIVMENREFLTVDAGRVIFETQRIRDRITIK